MGTKKRDVDLEKARLDPASVFRTPEEVLEHDGLGREQKIDILRRWAYDASEIAVAEEEGMPEGAPPMEDRILAALEALGGHYYVEHSPPTKQKGV